MHIDISEKWNYNADGSKEKGRIFKIPYSQYYMRMYIDP